MACSQCKGEAWLNIAHPARLNSIAWRVPCDLCNPEGVIPDPWLAGEITVTINEDGRVDELANSNTTYTIGEIDARPDGSSTDDR